MVPSVTHSTTDWSLIDVNEQDSCGQTKLHRASLANRVNEVKALLKVPSLNPNVTDNEGFTALQRACMVSNLEVFTELLKHPQQDLDFKTEEGKTADELAEGIVYAKLKAAKKQVKTSQRYVTRILEENERCRTRDALHLTENAMHEKAKSDELARLRVENKRLVNEREKFKNKYTLCVSAKDKLQRQLDRANHDRSLRADLLVENTLMGKRRRRTRELETKTDDLLQSARLKTEIRQLKIEQKILRANCASQKLEFLKIQSEMQEKWNSASVLGENLPREICGLSSAKLSETASALVRAHGQVLEAQKELEICSVCLEFPKTAAIDPCGHQFCEGCLNKNPTQLCFKCRGRITKRLRLF